MPDRRRKAVHVDAPIGKVLDAYVYGPDAPRKQGIVSAGLFLYFALPDSVRPIIQGFYESWRAGMEPHFHVDQVRPGPPLVTLDFHTQNTREAFCQLLAAHLQQAAPELNPSAAPGGAAQAAAPTRMPVAKRHRKAPSAPSRKT